MIDFKIVHYSADPWEHVCPVIRFSMPAQVAGFTHIRGNNWGENHQIQIQPELVEKADAVVIQRDFPRYVESFQEIITLAHRYGKPVVYDIDDLLIALPENHPDARHYELSRVMILQAVLEADVVTCSTEAIRQVLAPFNQNIQVLPNFLPDMFWKNKVNHVNQRKSGEPLIIGYVGGHSHAPDLEMISPVLENILENYRHSILFHCWGVHPPESLLKRSNVKFFDIKIWDYGQFCQYFSNLDIDIGIAPLIPNIFNECKSSIKYLEYGWLGIPTVYSSARPYTTIIQDGKNGFLAQSLDEWQNRLTQLIEDEQLRKNIGDDAHMQVNQFGFLSTHIDQWANFYTQLKPVERNKISDRNLYAFTEKAQEWHAELEERLNQQIELVRQGKDLTMQAWEYHARAQENIQQLNQTIALLDQQNINNQANILNYQETIRTLRSDLQKTLGSNSFILARKIMMSVGIFAPISSRRRRYLQSGFNGLRLLYSEGVSAFWRRLREKTRRSSTFATQEVEASGNIHLQRLIEPNHERVFPTIDVIIMQAPGVPSVDVNLVQHWSQQQTCPAEELILWNRDSSKATSLFQNRTGWYAPDFSSLCKEINSRYVVFWGADLLARDATYLEENLAALVSEDLLFTVNLNGDSTNANEWVSQKKLPGSEQDPFMRSIIHKDYLSAEGRIEIDARQDRVIGKIIVHSGCESKDPQLPLLERLTGVSNTCLVDNRVVAISAMVADPTNIKTSLHPIDMSITPTLVHSDQPTVLVATQYFATGGAENILLNNLRSLKNDIRFIVISLDLHNSSLGTTAPEFRQITPYIYSLPDFLDPLLNLSFINYLSDRFQPNCLYIANGANWLYDILPDFHQLYPNISIANQVYDHQLGWINRYSHQVVNSIDSHIASNPKISRAYEKRGVNANNIFYILNGVDTEEFQPDHLDQNKRVEILSQLGLPSDCKVVTFMARLHPQKRPFDFIELARRFENDPSIYFLMVGNGPLKEEVETQIARAGLKKLRRCDFYRPSREIYAISNALVLPSEYEGMPMVVLEALATGVPVIATDVGNNREILELTKGGIAVSNIGDIGALAEALRQMLSSPPDPTMIRQAVIQQFSIERMAEQYRKVFLRRKSA